jgi:hypothetical protein
MNCDECGKPLDRADMYLSKPAEFRWLCGRCIVKAGARLGYGDELVAWCKSKPVACS